MRHAAFSPIVAICASLTVAFGVCAGVRAGTLPDISGRWYANGNAYHYCHISQSGSSVSPASSSASASSSSTSSGYVAAAAPTPTPRPYRYLLWVTPGGPHAP